MADLKGYVTAAGQNFEALAKQMGYPITIGTIEIGDGVLPDNESPIARTNLVHYLKSFPAILEVDPVNPGQFIVSCNIPADDAINGAGYFIREMGCRLAGQGAGVLYAYRRISNDFKPLITQGEAKSFIYKLRFVPSNGELLTPVIDPSIVFASVQYCDNKVASELAKLDNKQSVRVATTGAIALAAAQTIDGVVLAVGDRVLVKDQADAKQNGVYLVAAQAWTRTTDADTGAKLNAGARIYVEEGTANGAKVWYLATTGAITLGTTQLQFKDEHPAATETVKGVTRYATQAEVDEPVPANQKDDAVVTVKKLWAWVKQASETVRGMMKVATQAQMDEPVIANQKDDVAITPKKAKAGFAMVTTTGAMAIRLPSWLGSWLLQGGTSAPVTNGAVVITFPISYPAADSYVALFGHRQSTDPTAAQSTVIDDPNRYAGSVRVRQFSIASGSVIAGSSGFFWFTFGKGV